MGAAFDGQLCRLNPGASSELRPAQTSIVEQRGVENHTAAVSASASRRNS
jgi:hypothetical protein